LITKLKLQPFIATLGTMSLYRGMALVMYDGQPINVSSYRYLGEGTLAGIPISVVLFLAVIAVAGAILQFMRFGRHTYAIGSNVEAAHHAGVRVDRTLIGIYTLGGLLTGLGAMIAMSRTVSAQPTAGVGAELDVIAAVVIGGASLSGGRGTITGTIVGTLLISFLRNGCTLVGISTNAQLIVIGVVIVLAVAVDQFTRRKAGNAA
jgi:ribose/xylose/arabinose/galactoside ABC-type transport system permease subunit